MRPRKCKDCGCDISGRYIKAQRCCDCAVKRQQRLANRRRRQARKSGRVGDTPLPSKEGRGMLVKICPECGAEFRPLHGSQVCCSDECKRNRLRRQTRESKERIRKLSPHQQMLANLRQRDAIAPKPKIEIINRDGIIIERRGTVPAGCHAAGGIRHNA